MKLDEKIEKLISISGNEHRYQYFSLILVMLLWANCNFLVIVLPFLERQPLVTFTDEDGKLQTNVTLTNEICTKYKGKYQIMERFDYSWVSEYDIECDSFSKSLIGMLTFTGNTLGSMIFGILSTKLTNKQIVMGSGVGFCISIFSTTLLSNTSIVYFYIILVFCVLICIFGNCMCYSSLVIIEESVSSGKRGFFSAMTNVGYASCGMIYSMVFMLLLKWRYVFIALICATVICSGLILFFLYNSPRAFIDKKDKGNTLKVLRGIAKFNGRYKLFEDCLLTEEYKEILDDIFGKEGEIKGEGGDVSTNNYGVGEEEGNDKKVFLVNNQNKKEEINKNEEKDKLNEVNEEQIKVNSSSEIEEENSDRKSETQNFREVQVPSEIDEIKEKEVNPITQKEPEKKKPPTGCCGFLSNKSIRKTFFTFCVLWFGTRMVYNGFTLSTKEFPGNFYFVQFLSYLFESISYSTLGNLINTKFFGRRGTLWLCYSILSLALILLAIFKFSENAELTVDFVARFFAAALEIIYYAYTLEVYPTSVRGAAFGWNATLGSFGCVLAPPLLEYLPLKAFLILFAILSGLCGGCLFLVPETVGKPMVEDV